jgi:hypothetical protein
MTAEVRLARLSQPEAESRLRNSRLAVIARGHRTAWAHLPLGRCLPRMHRESRVK